VRRGAPAVTGATRKGLSVSDGNKRVCPTPEVSGARCKRPAPARECAQHGNGAVIAARPQATPESFQRRAASAPALTVHAAPEEPIDLTNTSSGSEDGADAARGDLVSEITRLRAQVLEEQKGKRSKQQLVDEAALEVSELLDVVESLRKSDADARAQLAQLQVRSAASIADLQRRLAIRAPGDGEGAGCGADVVRGRQLLQIYVQHLAERLAEVISIVVPKGTSLSTIEGTVASAEQLAVDLANLIAEQRAKADSAHREAAEERRAREQVDAALVRAGQAAEATASGHVSAQLSQLEAEKNRQVWEMQQAMAIAKGTARTLGVLCVPLVDNITITFTVAMRVRGSVFPDEYERKIAEQRGEIICLERNLATCMQQQQQQQQQPFMAPPLTASKPIPVRPPRYPRKFIQSTDRLTTAGPVCAAPIGRDDGSYTAGPALCHRE
jgi:hypothetical protein